jgi:hypothetical protein
VLYNNLAGWDLDTPAIDGSVCCWTGDTYWTCIFMEGLRKTTETFLNLFSFPAQIWYRHLLDLSEHPYRFSHRVGGRYRTLGCAHGCLASQGRCRWSQVGRKHHLVIRMWPSGTCPFGETVKMQYATGWRDWWRCANPVSQCVFMLNSWHNFTLNLVFSSSY